MDTHGLPPPGPEPLPASNRLGRRLLGFIVLFSVAVSLVGTAVQLVTGYRGDVHALEDRLAQIQSSQAQALAESLWSLDESQVRLQLNGITTLHGIVLAEVDSALGPRYAAGPGQGARAELTRTFPLHHGERYVGTLRVGASLEDIHARLRGRVLVILATEAAKTFLVALFVFYLFQRLVTRHLATMAAYTRGLNPEHLDAPLRLRRGMREGPARDELEEVSAALNDMRESLRHELGERQRVEAGSAFLARAGAVLLESLDLEKVLPRIASLCVGALADWCIIDLVGEDGKVRRAGGAHVDPAKRLLLDELQRRYPIGPGSRAPAVQSMSKGETVLVPRLSEEELRALCVDDAHFQLVRELGVRGLLSVPLVARGQSLGALSFASAEPGHFGPAERSLAEELARRAAIAIDNARLYRHAEEAIRLRETFLSVAGHELRTPLLPLQLRLQSLLRRSRGGASLEPSVLLGEVAAAEWQTRRLGQLVDQFLDVSHLVAGNALELRCKRVDLCELVTGVLEGLQRQIEASGSAVVRELRCPAEGEWDPRRLETVVTGLVQNALKFGQGRPIDVRVVPGAGVVRLVVKDRGIGMSADDQAHIFDRFSRSVSELNYGGLGLGLYISRWVVEAHGGRISVESRPGEGATLTVELPAGEPSRGDGQDAPG